MVLHIILLNSHYIDGKCQNPQGQLGTCVSIKSCPSLLNLLKSNSQNQQVANFLRASVCGFQGRDPWVCCPSGSDGTGGNTGGTDNGDRGRTGITNTTYGPLYPPACGFGDAKLRRVVGGEPATLGTNDSCGLWSSFSISYSFLSRLSQNSDILVEANFYQFIAENLKSLFLKRLNILCRSIFFFLLILFFAKTSKRLFTLRTMEASFDKLISRNVNSFFYSTFRFKISIES